MLLGMGIVFTFLIVLVFALIGMSRLAAAVEAHHGIARPESTTPAAAPVTPGATGNEEGEVIAAISAAITKFRATRR